VIGPFPTFSNFFHLFSSFSNITGIFILGILFFKSTSKSLEEYD
jgi:hypothetical protein